LPEYLNFDIKIFTYLVELQSIYPRISGDGRYFSAPQFLAAIPEKDVVGSTRMFSTTPVHLSFPEDTEDNNKRCSQDKCSPVLRIQAKELGSRVLSKQQQ